MLKTFTAIDRAALSELERHGGFFAALRAHGRRRRAGRAGASSLATFGLAGLASFRLVLKAFLRVKKLFSRGEDKLTSALSALENLILVLHRGTP